jgi:hypothetical protein
VSGVFCREIKFSCRVADVTKGSRDQGLNFTLSNVRQEIMCKLKLLLELLGTKEEPRTG